jgi:3-oxoacyl-[acyl-carrier protein] reductase
MNKIDLGGKRAVVTGGARGIGLAVAERFLASGAKVALWDRDPTAIDAAAKRLAAGDRLAGIVVDVAEEAAIAAAVSATAGAFGGIDILVNNAGITGPNAPTWEYPVADWKRVIDVDLTGPFLCSRAAVPVMLEGGWGRVVNIASVAGKEGNPNAPA